jgi:DNA primase
MATDILVVVESPLDVVRLRCAGVEGAVSTFGAIVSEDQAKIMRRAEKVIAAFDKDEAGRKACESMRPFARKYGINLFFFDYTDIDVKDPGDMTIDEIHRGIENSKTYILGKEAYSVYGNA